MGVEKKKDSTLGYAEALDLACGLRSSGEIPHGMNCFGGKMDKKASFLIQQETQSTPNRPT